MARVIIEAAINGGVTTRAANPHVPCTADEVARDAVAAHGAGAAIVHFHLREPDGGRIATYARLLAAHVDAIRAIRQQPAPLLWNTFPVGGDSAQRFRLFRDLSADATTRPDVGAYDIGSLNIVTFDRSSHRVAATTYVNTFDDVCYFLKGFRELGLRPFLNVFEPGFLRTALICLELGLLDEPLILKLYFSDDYGLPPSRQAIELYLDLLDGVRHEWFGTYVGRDVLPYVTRFADMGGHVRVGLEDYDYADAGRLANAEIVQRAADALESQGHRLVGAAEAGELLALDHR
ncbi:MAG TPA: 3-keto-5-aminohexanoate cleavage protein [Acidimicrobiales bacterium]|jgi:uncharacterized protein (DUF849 family)|nr:3-keto-5-aminohexanoate cleavage protein [Acidimicrobiales bacterium]